MRGENREHTAAREGFRSLLRIKDSDIRILCLEQGRDAVDRGIHIGGAFSAVVPLVALYYGGYIRCSVEDPTVKGQDLFILSKGHAVAAMASVYADLGYLDRSVLVNSRSDESILNGHPGPLLPGVHIATGPEGHGLGVAQGFALAGREDPRFDVFCLTGDGEIQAGMVWEAVMHAGARKLDNLCLLVDKNEGQLDNPRALAFPMNGVEGWFESFGWRVFSADASDYDGVLQGLGEFRNAPRNGKPTAIICRTRKGMGGFSSFCVSHKGEISPELAAQEIRFQADRRELRVRRYREIIEALQPEERERLELDRQRMGIELGDQEKGRGETGKSAGEGPAAAGRAAEGKALGVGSSDPDRHAGGGKAASVAAGSARVRKAEPRDKKVPYDPGKLPALDPAGSYSANWVITECMKEFGKSGMVATVDSDLASTSGLEAGLAWADSTKAFNVGVAESNMMNIGEALAVLGYNTWVSTFCPFFDWRVMRRIAIGCQERAEVIESGGWLSKGHNLDLVFLATAPNLETRTNGATHMGNDDSLVFSELAGVRIVDLSCPNQLIGFMRWIMEGNRGLVYARILRASSGVLYGKDFAFEYGRGYRLRGGSGVGASGSGISAEDAASVEATIVSSGRGVHEALKAASILERDGIKTAVIDMPSFDPALMLDLCRGGKPVLLAEQNNGYLLKMTEELLLRENAGRADAAGIAGTIVPINCRNERGERRYVHSATYQQLLDRFGLSPEGLAKAVKRSLNGWKR